jgi:hypothetical protein
MSPRTVLAAVLFFASVPVCAAVAGAVAYLGDVLLGETVPSTCGKRGLVVGLMGIWAIVLFGFLINLADQVATRISAAPGTSATCGRELATLTHARRAAATAPDQLSRSAPLAAGSYGSSH